MLNSTKMNSFNLIDNFNSWFCNQLRPALKQTCFFDRNSLIKFSSRSILEDQHMYDI